MKFPIIASLLLAEALCAASARAEGNEPSYRQSYVILIKGDIAGSENVTEGRDGDGNILSASDHEVFVTDGLGTKRMAFATKLQLAKESYAPLHYSYRYTTGESGDSYEVVVKDGQINRTLIRNGRMSEAKALLKPDTIILDFNVYHQYDYLVRRYDAAKGGRQLFSDFVPLIGSDIPIALTSLGNGELRHEKGSLAVSNYKIEFVGISGGSLSVDKNGRLVRLVIPNQDLEVLRKDLLPAKSSD